MINLSRETEALARRVADAQKVSVDTAVRQALEARVHDAGIAPQRYEIRDRSPEAVRARRARIDQIAREIASMPVLDRRSPRAIADDLNAL